MPLDSFSATSSPFDSHLRDVVTFQNAGLLLLALAEHVRALGFLDAAGRILEEALNRAPGLASSVGYVLATPHQGPRLAFIARLRAVDAIVAVREELQSTGDTDAIAVLDGIAMSIHG